MALSTSITVVTRAGLSSHHHYRVRDLDSVGVATFSNFKTGLSNLHSIGFDVVDSITGTGVTVRSTGNAVFSGVITATKFVGDISEATGAAAGLGTALSQTQTDPLNKVYFTDKVLSISTTTTIDHPATANLAYTQYGDIKIEDGHDLIIRDGDDFKYDILGISTTKLASNEFPSGLSGDLTGDVTGNLTGNADTATTATTATTLKSNSSVSTSGIITASSFVGDVTGNLTGNVTTDKIIPTGGVPSGGGGGIIQVVNTIKTDTFSTGAAMSTKTTITGLTATITPKFSTSKILIIMNLLVGATADTTIGGTIERGSTPIGIHDARGSRTRNTFGCGIPASGATWRSHSVSHTILDSPNTTNATTYSVKIGGNGAQTVYINREARDADNATDTTVGTSTLTLMEISA